MVKLGLLGGTFDPIHNGHLYLAQAAYQALNLSTVLFIPAGDPPHKQDIHITSAQHRLSMLERAIAGKTHFTISPVDLDRPGPHYTVDTVSLIRERYQISKEDCYFIIGTDSLIDLPTWYQPKTLVERCQLAVIHRPNYLPDLTTLADVIPNLTDHLRWVETAKMTVSSTEIRRRLRQGESTIDLIPQAVCAYISQHHLYQQSLET